MLVDSLMLLEGQFYVSAFYSVCQCTIMKLIISCHLSHLLYYNMSFPVNSHVFCTTTCHLSRLLYYNMSTLLTGQHSYFIERRHYTGRSRSLSGDRLPRSVSPSVTMISPRSSSTKRVITEENPYTSMRETTETSGLFLYSSSYQNGCWGHA